MCRSGSGNDPNKVQSVRRGPLGRRSGAERLEAASARALHLQSYSYRTVKNILSSAQDRLPFGDTETPPTPHHDNIRGAAYYADPEETHSC